MVSPYKPHWWRALPESERDVEKFNTLVVKLRLDVLTPEDAQWLDMRVRFSRTFNDDDLANKIVDIAHSIPLPDNYGRWAVDG